MNQAKPQADRGKTIILIILGVVLAAAIFLTVLGMLGVKSGSSENASSVKAAKELQALKSEAEALYANTIEPALSRADETVRSSCQETARSLLAQEWGCETTELADYTDEDIWNLLSMTYSYSRKKLSGSQRKSLAKISDVKEAQDHMLAALSSGKEISEDPVLAEISALEEADNARIMQVFLASENKDGTVLNKDTSLAFIRVAGKGEEAVQALKTSAGGKISPVIVWIGDHARTLLLAGILLIIDVVLLFFLLRADRSWKPDLKWILILVIIDFLLVFQLLPLLFLIVKAFFPNGSFSLDTFIRLYTYKMNWQALTNTAIASACTMVLGTLIAFPLAWLVGRTNMYGRTFFRRLFVLTYMVPPYVGAMAWLRLLNKNVGTINLALRAVLNLNVAEGPLNIYSLGGLIWVLTTFYYPYAFITISRAMEKMDPSLEEASRISGANPLKTLLKITLPMMTPSLIAGALLVFVCAASCYGIPSIIGAPGNVHTVTTRIIQYYGLGVKGINDATGLAFFLIVIAVFVLYISDFVVAKRQYITVSGKSVRPTLVDLRRWRLPITLLVCLFAVIAVAIPFVTILLTSFKTDVGKTILAAGNFTFKQWKALFRAETLSCLKNSLIFGTLAATVGIVISCTMSYLLQRTKIRGRKIPDFLITLGSGTPSVVIALGLIMTMRGQFGIDIYGTAVILVIAYLVKYLMMGMRTVVSAMSQIHVSLEECSQISGASWLKTMLRITGPLIFPSIAAGWFLIFIPSFYELSMTTLLYSTNTKTVGFQLYEYWTFTSQPQACAMAFGILMIVVALNFIMNRLTKGNFSI